MTETHTEVFLVRHGQTDSNTAGLFHGATDVPLNALGLRQAECVARRIQQLERLQALYASPLQRARATAETIGAVCGLATIAHAGLTEMHFGAAEGLTMNAMLERFPEHALRFQDLGDMDVAFPGGESRREFHTRVRAALDDIVTHRRGERLLIVSHAGVIGSLVAQILGGDPNDWRAYQVSNCSVTHLELRTDGPIAHVVNDTVHLNELKVVEATEA